MFISFEKLQLEQINFFFGRWESDFNLMITTNNCSDATPLNVTLWYDAYTESLLLRIWGTIRPLLKRRPSFNFLWIWDHLSHQDINCIVGKLGLQEDLMWFLERVMLAESVEVWEQFVNVKDTITSLLSRNHRGVFTADFGRYIWRYTCVKFIPFTYRICYVTWAVFASLLKHCASLL